MSLGSPFGITRLSLVMTNGDPEGQIFISHPDMNNGFFFMLPIIQSFGFVYYKKPS